MKKIIFTTALYFGCLITGFTGHTQISRQVPEEIKLAFDINFNEASLIRWEKTQDGYKAVFDQGKGKLEAYFNKRGGINGLGRSIDSSLLPVKVFRKLSRQYARFLPEEICEYTCNVKGLCYIISMHNEKVRRIVMLSPSGKLLDEERQKIKKMNKALAPND